VKIEDLRALASSHGLTDEEFDLVVESLGRAPTVPEVGVVSAMWSEHCSYKSSRVHLKKLPTQGPQVVQGPGENAGAVDIGGGLAAVFKMESHNHPSYIEPYQGAATGVGGILRDVFTMGARPIGSLNSLRFGAIDHEKTPHLFHGVVAGIAGYGNCIGVPTVGGEVYFDPCYDGNILVNVFTVGIARKDRIFKGVAEGVGNPIFYVGAGTGRDGIHGATMASESFGEGSEEKRPTVQVGDPFREKLLLEAVLELMDTGAIIGIQDMGAAGLTSSSVEMADRAGNGIRIDTDLIPKREENMSAYECLLSESQERMLVVLERGREEEVARVFARWELECAQIGVVTDTGNMEVLEGGERVVNLPVDLLTSAAPVYDRPRSRPGYLGALAEVALPEGADVGASLLDLMGAPNICSRRRVYERFDHMVGVGTVVGPGAAGAAVLRVPGTDRAVAIAVDCSSRFCYLDPREGAMLAVAECARNVACTGARPLGTTDCLNFGDPTNPEIMWQFAEAVEGMAEACAALDVPIVGGNVSLYNASFGRDINPTPTVAVVGAFDDGAIACGSAFGSPGDAIVLLGQTSPEDMGGSEYAWLHGAQIGARPPALDLDAEVRVQALIRDLVRAGTARSAHDCSEGGLGVALAECCVAGGVGATLDATLGEGRADAWLFSESPSRVVLTCAAGEVDAVLAKASGAGVPAQALGVVGGESLVWPDYGLDVEVEALRGRHEGGLAGL
jgi:phosphoribosylformylglycinamidine synthase